MLLDEHRTGIDFTLAAKTCREHHGSCSTTSHPKVQFFLLTGVLACVDICLQIPCIRPTPRIVSLQVQQQLMAPTLKHTLCISPICIDVKFLPPSLVYAGAPNDQMLSKKLHRVWNGGIEILLNSYWIPVPTAYILGHKFKRCALFWSAGKARQGLTMIYANQTSPKVYHQIWMCFPWVFRPTHRPYRQ